MKPPRAVSPVEQAQEMHSAGSLRPRKSESFLRGGTEFMPESMRIQMEKKARKKSSLYFASVPKAPETTGSPVIHDSKVIGGTVKGSLRVKARNFSSNFVRSVRKVFKSSDEERMEMPAQHVESTAEHYLSYDSPADMLDPAENYQSTPVRYPSFRYKPSSTFRKLSGRYGGAAPAQQEGDSTNPWSGASMRTRYSTWSAAEAPPLEVLRDLREEFGLDEKAKERPQLDEDKDDEEKLDKKLADMGKNSFQRSSVHNKVFASLLRRVGRRGSTPVLEHTLEGEEPEEQDAIKETPKEDIVLELPRIPPTDKSTNPFRRRSFSFRSTRSTIRKVSPFNNAHGIAETTPPAPEIPPPPPPPPLPESIPAFLQRTSTPRSTLTENTRPQASPQRNGGTPGSPHSLTRKPRPVRGSTFFPSGLHGSSSTVNNGGSPHHANTNSPLKRAMQEHQLLRSVVHSPSIYSQPGLSSVGSTPLSTKSHPQHPISPIKDSPTRSTPPRLNSHYSPSPLQSSTNSSTLETQNKLRIAKRKGSVGSGVALLESAIATAGVPSRWNEMRRVSSGSYRASGGASGDWSDEYKEEKRIESGSTFRSFGGSVRLGRRRGSVAFL